MRKSGRTSRVRPGVGCIWRGCAAGCAPGAELHMSEGGGAVGGGCSSEDRQACSWQGCLVVEASKLAAVPAGFSEVAATAALHEGKGCDAGQAHSNNHCREGQAGEVAQSSGNAGGQGKGGEGRVRRRYWGHI